MRPMLNWEAVIPHRAKYVVWYLFLYVFRKLGVDHGRRRHPPQPILVVRLGGIRRPCQKDNARCGASEISP